MHTNSSDPKSWTNLIQTIKVHNLESVKYRFSLQMRIRYDFMMFIFKLNPNFQHFYSERIDDSTCNNIDGSFTELVFFGGKG